MELTSDEAEFVQGFVGSMVDALNHYIDPNSTGRERAILVMGLTRLIAALLLDASSKEAVVKITNEFLNYHLQVLWANGGISGR